MITVIADSSRLRKNVSVRCDGRFIIYEIEQGQDPKAEKKKYTKKDYGQCTAALLLNVPSWQWELTNRKWIITPTGVLCPHCQELIRKGEIQWP